MHRACKDCVYWDNIKENAALGITQDDLGACRFYPPRAGGMPYQWPCTLADDWCGHWNGLEPERAPAPMPPLRENVRYGELRQHDDG